MSLNASVMSLANGGAALLAGAIVSQQAPGEPLEGFGTVGLVAAGFTLVAIFMAYRMTESSGEVRI